MLQRIEALPGNAGYAVTFVFGDGSEQSAAVRIADADIDVAEASLPATWRRDQVPFGSLRRAVLAVDAARQHRPAGKTLSDVDGGWDVALGNVVLDSAGPRCTAHGAMIKADGLYECSECGARALVS